MMTVSIPCVEPDKFLLDYKILIFALAILIASIVIAYKKKTWKKVMTILGVSNVIVTIKYVYDRIYETSEYGYFYFLETNSDFNELIMFVLGLVVLFLVIFLIEKVIERIKGGK